MKHGAPQFHTWPRWLPGLLTAFCGLLVGVSLLSLSVGVSYGRYLTTGTADVSFQVTPKPTAEVNVTETETLPQGEGENPITTSMTCLVTCDGVESADVRVRFYASGETAPVLTVQTADNTVYTLTARGLKAATVSGTDLGVNWVYIITDTDGNEVLFAPKAEGLVYRIQVADNATDISQLEIRAEAVR